jgi:hypothetical protein
MKIIFGFASRLEFMEGSAPNSTEGSYFTRYSKTRRKYKHSYCYFFHGVQEEREKSRI